MSKAPQPWHPAAYKDADVLAIQAVARGVASADQQRQALDWIIQTAAATYDQPFRPGSQEGDRATVFTCGRMFVGQQIVKLMKLPIDVLNSKDKTA